MFKKIALFLLLLNLVAVLVIGYKINKHLSFQEDALKLIINMEIKLKEDDEKFRANMHKGLGLIMSGQSRLVVNQELLNVGILRVHHFSEPHDEKFYPACPECQKEKGIIPPEEDDKA